MKTYKTKDFIKILKDNGYRKTSYGTGSHVKFINVSTRKTITLPVNKADLNPCLTEGIIKRNKLHV